MVHVARWGIFLAGLIFHSPSLLYFISTPYIFDNYNNTPTLPLKMG
jgi:hypothetical protein